MTRRQFYLGVLVVLTTIPLIVWGVSHSASQSRKAEIEKARIDAAAKADREQKKLERTQERWDAAKRLPFLRKKEKTDGTGTEKK